MGGIPIRWTKEKCIEEAKKYNTRSEFSIGSSGAYAATHRNQWQDEVCKDLEEVTKPNGYWSKAQCILEAKKYTSRKEFSKGTASAYNACLTHGWLEEACSHMEELHKPANYWNKERCAKVSKKYTSRKEFALAESSVYSTAARAGWLDEICDHMVRKLKPQGYWSEELCAIEAKKYTSRSEFMKNSGAAYTASWKKGWLDEICKHMEYIQLPNGYWSEELCAIEAKKYKTKSEFYKHSTAAASAAYKNKWIDKICTHMVSKYKPHGFWKVKENCFQEVRRYKNISELCKHGRGAYAAIIKCGWLDETRDYYAKLKNSACVV